MTGSRAKMLKRVLDLIQRAQETTFEEEARTCALLAVRLMKEHKLRVVLGRERSPTEPADGSWRGRERPVKPQANWSAPRWDAGAGQYVDPFVERARGQYGPHPRATVFCDPRCNPETGHVPECPRYFWEQRR